MPVNFSQIARLFEQVIDLDTFVVTASPMAAGGSFSRGTHNDFTSVAARRARRLIVEMNQNIPRVFGQSQIHDRDDLPLLHRHRHPPPRMTFTTELTGAPKVTDPDSRVTRTQGQPTIQGYNAQAAVTGDQIIIAAEIATESPDFGHLEPVFNAALRDLKLAGMHERPGIVLADAGYWHKRQMQSIVSDGTQVLVPPDSSLKENPRPMDGRAL